MTLVATQFTGFQPEAIQFLADLAVNNERAWFQPRKAEYERLLKQPLEALCDVIAERFAAKGVPLTADRARSPFRIYRDVRFSRNKEPYKTNIGASFPWTGGGHHDAGGYFHFQPGEMFAGGGMWHPDREWLTAWRATVDGDAGRVHAAIDEPTFRATFGTVNGDRLKRVPPGFAADHPEAELLKLKDVTFGRRLSDAEALSAELPDILVETFASGVPVYRLLGEIGQNGPSS
jgi:uncharacterized protein (TIGR02453 family)